MIGHAGHPASMPKGIAIKAKKQCMSRAAAGSVVVSSDNSGSHLSGSRSKAVVCQSFSSSPAATNEVRLLSTLNKSFGDLQELFGDKTCTCRIMPTGLEKCRPGTFKACP